METPRLVWADFKQELCDNENDHFKDLFHALRLDADKPCGSCGTFNLSILDLRQRYRCACPGRCPGVTFSKEIVSYCNKKLGWITREDHLKNCGIE